MVILALCVIYKTFTATTMHKFTLSLDLVLYVSVTSIFMTFNEIIFIIKIPD